MYIESFRKFVSYFGSKRKTKLIIFFIMSLIAGFLEFFGIALIYPFVMIIINPSSVQTLPLNSVQIIGNFINNHSPLFIAFTFGLGAMLLFVLKNIYMIFYLFFQSSFLQKWTQDINNIFMQFYLYAPYKQMLKVSNADKLYAVTTASQQSTNGFLMRVMTIITNVSIVGLVLLLILYKFPLAGIISVLFIVSSVIFQNRIFKSKADLVNREVADTTKVMNNITYSNINNIKEVKITGSENRFYDLYVNQGEKLSSQNALLVFFAGVSPYLIETLIVVTLIILGSLIAFENVGKSDVLVASFALIVASIFRIAPALNRIQSCILNLSATQNFVNSLIKFYEDIGLKDFETTYHKEFERLDFRRDIVLENINYSYDNKIPVLKNVSFKINKGEFIGIIGLSGAGKSTLADVITGLLPVDSGEILLDGVKLDQSNFYAFRNNIGYVQQEITVLETSFRENVAWGVPSDKIDDTRVEKLLHDVCLWELVAKYENGIYAVPFVGENGFSQGQKQRLAIARALYRNPEILIFDEATSSLDVKTEFEITSVLKKLCGNKTIISIAHRLSTLQACNRLIYMKSGTIVDIGTFEELSSKYPDFAELVRLSTISR